MEYNRDEFTEMDRNAAQAAMILNDLCTHKEDGSQLTVMMGANGMRIEQIQELYDYMAEQGLIKPIEDAYNSKVEVTNKLLKIHQNKGNWYKYLKGIEDREKEDLQLKSKQSEFIEVQKRHFNWTLIISIIAVIIAALSLLLGLKE